MSSPMNTLLEEQFSCSICLEIFNNPVSTPCGHSFCLKCITSYWDKPGNLCLCPMCKKTFPNRPEVHINHTIKEITEQYRGMLGASGGSSQPSRAALESTSSSSMNNNQSGRRRFSLFQRTISNDLPLIPPPPSSNNRRRFTAIGFGTNAFRSAPPSTVPQCIKHGLSLDMFCKHDMVCICALCERDGHQGHAVVEAQQEMKIRKSHLGIMEAEVEGLIFSREQKIEEIQTAKTQIQVNAQQETEVTTNIFHTLVSDLEKSKAEMLNVVQKCLAASELRSRTLIKDLQLEIDELKRRRHALSDLTQSNDQDSFFKTYLSLGDQPEMKDWTNITLTPDPKAGAVMKTVNHVAENLQEELRKLPKLCLQSVPDSPSTAQPRGFRPQDFARDVILDLDTAHPRIEISKDFKQVYLTDSFHSVSNTPSRFERMECALGQQPISSGCHYWEVQVSGRADWDLGVVSHAVNRKAKTSYSPANGFWVLRLRNKYEYTFRSDPPKSISLQPRPEKVGIYVDYEKGQVSFYNADIMAPIFTHVGSFNDILYPLFGPHTKKIGRYDDPLIICPIKLIY